MTPRGEHPRTFGFAGDGPTGAELLRLWPALAGPQSVATLDVNIITSLSWETAAEKLAALMIVPETSSWSRSRHRRPTGPQPVRDHNWPWGLPWLSPRDRDKVEAQNDSLRDLFKLMSACVEQSPSTHLVLLHPEDLGPAENGILASIWRLPEIRLWANHWGLKRYCTHQCIFGKSKWPFPLGLLSTHPLPHKWFRPGWPKFESESGRYTGPLPKRCNCPPGSHARDADYRGRNLRERPESLIQPGLLEFMSSLMLGIPQKGETAAELSQRGSGLPLVRADRYQEEEEVSNDSTDAEQAELGTEELLRLQGSADAAGQASWDSLALRALGFQELGIGTYSGSAGTTKSEGNIGFGTAGRNKNCIGTGTPQEIETRAKSDDASKENLFLDPPYSEEQVKKTSSGRHGSETAPQGGTEVKPQTKKKNKRI